MKKLAIMALLSLNFAFANPQSLIDSIMHIYNLKTNGAFDFNATKSGDGYDITIDPKDPFYKEVLNKKLMHISYDDGPIVTNPKFTLASAGLSAKGSVLDFLSPQIKAQVQQQVKGGASYSYEGVVSFSKKLEEEFKVAPLTISENNMTLQSSALTMQSTTDLTTAMGDTTIRLDSVAFEDKSKASSLYLKGLDIKNSITDKPVDGIILFGTTSLSAKELGFKGMVNTKAVDAKFSVDINSVLNRVDEKFLDATININYKALDAKSIVLAQGIEKSKMNLAFKNFGVKGTVEFIKLSQELEALNSQMQKASQSGDDIAIQKAIIATSELTNKLVPIINDMLIKDKSNIVLDWSFHSLKQNHINLDLIYKGEPLSGPNIQSALISLMAQQLAIVDGTFDIAIEREVIAKVNPLFLLFLDMAKSKGFVHVKDSIYYFKGALKGGKIIINGKSYTIEELTKALF